MSISGGSNFGSGLFAIFFGVAIFTSFLASFFGVGVPRFEIVASANETTSGGWELRGKVIYKGVGIPGTKVWAIARDSQGNRIAPKTIKTNQEGDFVLHGIPKVIGSLPDKEVIEVTVFATGNVIETKDGEIVIPKTNNTAEETASTEKSIISAGGKIVKLTGEELLGLGNTGRTRWVQLPITALISIPILFLTSLMLGLGRFSADSSFAPKLQYFGSAGLGLIFVITMVAYISAGLYVVSVSGSPGDALSLGFATVFHGTYVDNVSPEWLFSLTAPEIGNKALVGGLGAPLWVLLLSVLGSSVFTVSLLVSHITKKIDLTDVDGIRVHVQEIVKHQFYVLFSPLGAVIVYQLLVIAGAASQTITVAIAAIAAGVGLNGILNKAIRSVEGLLSDGGSDEVDESNNSTEKKE